MDLTKKLREFEAAHSQTAQSIREDALFQVANSIERARIRAGLTQSQLAERIGTHQSAIARMEGGKSNISIKLLTKIAEALGTHLILPEFTSTATLNLVSESDNSLDYARAPLQPDRSIVKTESSAESEEFIAVN